jgi:hypothetical protein
MPFELGVGSVGHRPGRSCRGLLPGFSGNTSLSATPKRPACPSRASGWSSLTTLWGFPCCVRFPCVRAAATTPVQRLGVVFAHLTQPYQPSPKPLSARPAHRPFRGLLGVHSRCGPHTCAVTKDVTAIRGLQTFRRLHACPGCFRLERLAGRGLHPLEMRRLFTAHRESGHLLLVDFCALRAAERGGP